MRKMPTLDMIPNPNPNPNPSPNVRVESTVTRYSSAGRLLK